MKRLIKGFEASGTMERQKDSGRPQTATTPEHEESVEEMICSQEDHLGTHIAERLKISQSLIRK